MICIITVSRQQCGQLLLSLYLPFSLLLPTKVAGVRHSTASVILQHNLKTKQMIPKSSNLVYREWPTSNMVWGQKVRSQGKKVQNHIEGDWVAVAGCEFASLLSADRLVIPRCAIFGWQWLHVLHANCPLTVMLPDRLTWSSWEKVLWDILWSFFYFSVLLSF